MFICHCNICFCKKNSHKIVLAHDCWWCLTAWGLIKEEEEVGRQKYLSKEYEQLRLFYITVNLFQIRQKIFYRTCTQRIRRKRIKSFFTYYLNTLIGRNLSQLQVFSYLRSRIGSNEYHKSEERLRDRTTQVSWKRCPDIAIIAKCVLKGQCHEIFHFWFFSWICFPQAPDYTIIGPLRIFRWHRRQICHRCRWYRWQICHPYFQGLGGRWFTKKACNKKSRDTVPLNTSEGIHWYVSSCFLPPWLEGNWGGRPMRIQEWLLCVSH